MLEIDVNKLEETWQQLQRFLKDGFVAGDIWDRTTGLSVSSKGLNPEAAALFNQLTGRLLDTLDDSGFPTLGNYYMLNLDDKLFVIIRHGDDILQGLLLDPSRVNIGILFTVAIPKALASVKAARN